MCDLAIITYDFAPDNGGVQNYLHEIACRLGKKYEIAVITPIDGLTHVQSNFRRVVSPVSRFSHILGQLKPKEILVGHAHPKLLLAAYLYNSTGYSTLAHGNDFRAAQKCWHRPFFNWLLRRSRIIITNSRVNYHALENIGCRARNLHVIYPGTDPEVFRPAAKDQQDNNQILLTIGRLVPRKGIDTTLEALSLIREKYPELRYRIVGKGPDRHRLESLIKRFQLSHIVEFESNISRQELAEIYRQASIFVMPSREIPEISSIEGFGIVYLEASASGLPVVAARSGGVEEAVIDGKTGVLVEPDNPDALANTIEKLLDDLQLRERLGANGRRWVKETMNWDRAARELEEGLAL